MKTFNFIYVVGTAVLLGIVWGLAVDLTEYSLCGFFSCIWGIAAYKYRSNDGDIWG